MRDNLANWKSERDDNRKHSDENMNHLLNFLLNAIVEGKEEDAAITAKLLAKMVNEGGETETQDSIFQATLSDCIAQTEG